MSEPMPCAFGSPGRWRRAPLVLDPPLAPAWLPPPNEDIVDPPVLGHGLAYCVSRPRGLVALDAATGREVWRQETQRAWGNCLLTDGTLVSTPRPGVLTVLDPVTGVELASHTVSNIQLQVGVIIDRLVVSPLEPGVLGAWDIAAGNFAWRVPTPWTTAPLAAGTGIVCVAEEHAFVARDLANGAERWRFDVTERGRHSTIMRGEQSGVTVGHPIVTSDSVYVGVSGGTLAALDIASGTPRWTAQVGGIAPHNFALAPNGDLLFLSDDALVTIDATTGVVRAVRLLTDVHGAKAHEGPFAPMSVTERYVWTVDRQGRLVAIARADARVAWRVDLGGRVAFQPAIADGRLFVVDLEGHLTVYTAGEASSFADSAGEGRRRK
jgi:outer membrane protein assembly factor BamB